MVIIIPVGLGAWWRHLGVKYYGEHGCVCCNCILVGLVLSLGWVGCGGARRAFPFVGKLSAQFACYYKSPEQGLNLSGS